MPRAPQEIVDHLRTVAERPLKADELARGLGVEDAEYDAFTALLDSMEAEGLVYRVQRQRYAVPDRINLLVGRLHTIRGGAGFVAADEGGDDLYVPADSLEGAVHGDRVVARIEKRTRGSRREGTVVKVLKRGRERLVGIYHPVIRPAGPASARRPPRQGMAEGAPPYGYVVPQDTRMPRDILVPGGDEQGARDGDVVVVRVVEWGRASLGPAGVVEEVLGRPADQGVDMLAVLHNHDLQIEFPPEVEQAARLLREAGLQPADLAGREDLREQLIFTIDPADARDHDDALSVRPLGPGLWEVGVHIADVAHYVAEGSALDEEALRRGTSVYLVDRVVPMLPHDLSSDLCSLRPDEDRLALSLMLTVDEMAEVRDQRLVRSVIRSRHRLSYEQAQSVLDGAASISEETDAAIRQLAALSRVLRSRRTARGSLDFDLPEARVVLNTAGEPTDIQRVLRLEAHLLIEDFMILANESIARRAADAKLPFVYRIHERPDPTRLEQLRELAATFGQRLGTTGQVRPRDIQKFLASVRGQAVEHLLSTVTLRSMKQARYSAENVGHYGLAAPHYAHFTSPIRRYPDLLAHRLCGRYFLDGERPDDGLTDRLAEVARLCSERERVAVAAERESIDLKKVEFMERHLGDEFDGTISSVAAFGFFVLLDAFHVEGLVHISSLDDDYYEHVEEQYVLVGSRKGRRFRLGDRVRVQVASVNREERKIDFRLLSSDQGRGGRSRRGKRAPRPAN
jgi:ribonuclease R